MPAEVETMFSVREVPWHGLGEIVSDTLDSEQALVKAGLAWSVVKRPVYYTRNVGGVDHYTQVPDQYATVRVDRDEVLGIVSGRYKIVQNREAFAFTDALIGTGEVRYETAGALRGGRRVWLLAHLGREVQILGDAVEPFLLFTNGHDGLYAVKVALTPVRVVCQNTLNLALEGARRSWSIMHTMNVHQQLHEARRVLGLATTYVDRLAAEAEELAATPVPRSKWEEIVGQLISMPDDATSRVKERVQTDRATLVSRMYVPDLANFVHTGWGAVNAVADFEAHRPPSRETPSWRERRFESITDGGTLLDKTYSLVTSLN